MPKDELVCSVSFFQCYKIIDLPVEPIKADSSYFSLV